MRVIHLCFQLHTPYGLRENLELPEKTDYFDAKAEFARENEEVYQPLFALLERNVQKFSTFRVSLIVSGAWMELAERYDAELIKRLRKLAVTKHVELVIEPYYHSLVFFQNHDEMAEQVKLEREKLKQLFDAESKILALPELMYNDVIGQWAEENGFVGMLVGGTERALRWHSPNYVYEAAGCKYLRLLFRNSHLSEMVGRADEKLLAKKKKSEDEVGDEKEKLVLSAAKFRKLLELDCLRGNLVNLYFDARVIAERREDGIIGFFDELINAWLGVAGNQFVTASEACTVMTPTEEISIRETVGWWHEEYREKSQPKQVLPVLLAEVDCQLPKSWCSKRQKDFTSELYGLYKEILASEDEQLITDFRKLTAADFVKDLSKAQYEKLQVVLQDLKRRAGEVKKSQAVKISRTYTKRRDRGDVAGPVRAQVRPVQVEVKMDGDANENTSAPRPEMSQTEVPRTAREFQKAGLPPLQRQNIQPVQEAEIIIDGLKPKKSEAKDKSSGGIRKIIRKLVIE